MAEPRFALLPGEGIPQTVYALTWCIQQRIMEHFRGTGLHWGLRRILQRLWVGDGLSQAELARTTKASEASTSNMLKHLESGGWVERRADRFDHRILRVYLTAKAATLRDAVEETCGAIDREIRGALREDEGDLLAWLLSAACGILASPGPYAEPGRGIGIYDQPSPPGDL